MGTRSTSRPPERPAAIPAARLGAALALLLALALAPAAAAHPHDAADQPAPPAAAAVPMAGLLLDPPLPAPETPEDEIRLAALEIGPMLHNLALTGGDGAGPPPWRGYVLMATLWLGLFVLLVALSAAARERQALLRRRAWRRRADGLYE